MLRMLYRTYLIVFILLLGLTITACGPSGGTTSGNSTNAHGQQTLTPTVDSSTPTAVTATPTSSIVATATAQSGSSNGPSIILTPTPAPGGGQQVTFPDRILIIGKASQLASVGNSTPVSLVLTIKNTGMQIIDNKATFFQLVGAEGDVFGYQSSVTPGFYGTISPQTAHSGAIVFLVPTGAMSGGLRLLYRSEIDSETVFVGLQIT